MAAAGSGLAVVATVLSGTAAHAETTIEVQSDSGAAAGTSAGTQLYGAAETLADAIAFANANGGATITFASSLSGSTIYLNGTFLKTDEPVTIEGDNAITIDGGGSSIFGVCYSDLCPTSATEMTTISGLTLTGAGLSTSSPYYSGTAIVSDSPLTLDDVTISGNAGLGSAVLSDAPLYVDDSTFTDNDNTSALGAGAIAAFYGLAVENSTFYGNSGPDAGAIDSQSFDSHLVGDTIADNHATVSGEAGGITNTADAQYWTVNLDDSIVAQNTALGAPSDVAGNIDAAFSLIGDDAGAGIATDSTDLTGTAADPIDPDLGALADNGGPTETMAPQSDSPALASGNAYNFYTTIPAFPFDVDQRGDSRVGTGALSEYTGTDFTDMGAVEIPPKTVLTTVPGPSVTSLSAPSGSPGKTITIKGSNFSEVESVTFGSTATSFTVDSPTEITATIPSGKAGSKVDVRVSTLFGESPVKSADNFVFYKTQSKTAKRGDRKTILTTAASTVPLAKSEKLAITLKTTKLAHKTPSAKFKRVVFDFKGVKATHTYKHASGTEKLSLSSLKPGKHTLDATVRYTEDVGGRTKTVNVVIKVALDVA